MQVHIAWFAFIVPALTFIWHLARRTDPEREKSLAATIEAKNHGLKSAIETTAKEATAGFARVEKSLDAVVSKLETIGTKVTEHGVHIDLLRRKDDAA